MIDIVSSCDWPVTTKTTTHPQQLATTLIELHKVRFVGRYWGMKASLFWRLQKLQRLALNL